MARFDELISEVEDLDPEPPPKGRAWLRELVVGMVLLVGVLGFAGWQWWHTEYRQQNYAAGRAALATFNWEQAAAYFAGAEGYRDADDLIKVAREKAAERDRLYGEATHAMQSQAYIGALETLQKLQGLQPGYKDTSAMRNAASTEVYREALGGTVAMRVNTEQPGLYYRSGDAWFYLLGSDRRSRMRSLDYDSHIIYDVPREVGAAPEPSGPPKDPDDLTGRSFMLADLTGAKPVARPISLDPKDVGWLTLGRKGAWTVQGTSVYRSEYSIVKQTLPEQDVSFVDYATGGTSLVYNAGMVEGKASVIVGLDTASDRLIVAEWDAEMNSRIVTSTTDIKLWLVGPSGERRLIHELKGSGLQSIQLSEDRRYALLLTFTTYRTGPPEGFAFDKQTLLLVDLRGDVPPRTIDQAVVASYDYTSKQYEQLTAAFVADGIARGRPAVVVAKIEPDATHLRLFDPAANPAGNMQSLMDVAVRTLLGQQWEVNYRDGKRMILSSQGTSYSRGATQPITMTLTFVTMEIGREPVVFTTTTRPEEGVVSVNMVGRDSSRWVVVRLLEVKQGKYYWALTSLPLADLSGPGARFGDLFAHTAPDGDEIAENLRTNVGPQLLAYVQDGTLHARSYDGQSDVELETGVTVLYDRSLFRLNPGRLR